MRSPVTLTIFLLVSSCLTFPDRKTFELDKRGTEATSPTKAARRAQAVKSSFLFAWNGYYAYAFPNDELHPVSNGFGNSRNGWGASAVDALSTACVMGLREVVNDILAYIPHINYKHSKYGETVSLFETTIRYLGGMLSGYDLLKGPFSYLANSTENVESLLEQAKTLANLLSYAFDTPSGIPRNNLFFPHDTDESETNGLAMIGTLILEWTRLSDLTGNKTYAGLVGRAESYLVNPQPLQDQPFPGLVGTNVDVNTGRFKDAKGGWIGGDDSFYEYLIKMYVYDSGRFGYLRDRWILAADSSMAYIASHPTSRPDLTFLATYDHTKLSNDSQHLACFDGGNFLLGGAVLGRQNYIDFGLELVNGCHDTYESTVSGIGPEMFSWDVQNLPASQIGFYNKHGFYITQASYDLRPEVLESYYYAYKITGDTKYQDWAWDGFLAITTACRARSGYSAIYNVNLPGGGSKNDNQESFLFAEVMKYAYLIHAPDDVYDVNYGGTNQWVFNTEGHPLKVAGTAV